MPIRTSLWRVSDPPEQLAESSLTSEQFLENMIVRSPSILSDEWMLVGRQVDTDFGGRIDLLAITPDGSLVVIELKRERTPREVVAQALDYASWVNDLGAEDIAQIYGRFAPGKSLAEEFHRFFGQDLDEDALNQNHQIAIVAASLDGSTERIVSYLSKRDVAINVLCFQVFADGEQQLLSRAWLLDPMQAQVSAASPDNHSEPWNGEFYCSFGHGKSRSWEDAVEHGFICGGGGAWYSRTLNLLNPGDRVWVRVPSVGFVGVGRATGRALPASTFEVSTPDGPRPVLEVAKRGDYHKEFLNDPEKCEYFVPVKWLQTVPLRHAVKEVGLFGNQNTVCKPTTSTWRDTVEFLRQKFPEHDQATANER